MDLAIPHEMVFREMLGLSCTLSLDVITDWVQLYKTKKVYMDISLLLHTLVKANGFFIPILEI